MKPKFKPQYVLGIVHVQRQQFAEFIQLVYHGIAVHMSRLRRLADIEAVCDKPVERFYIVAARLGIVCVQTPVLSASTVSGIARKP